jgi:hypothetical protein
VHPLWHRLHGQTGRGCSNGRGQTTSSRNRGAKTGRPSSGHPDVWRRLCLRGTGQVEIGLPDFRSLGFGLCGSRCTSFGLADFRSLGFGRAGRNSIVRGAASARSGIGERSTRRDPDLRLAGSAIRRATGRQTAGSRTPVGNRGPAGNRIGSAIRCATLRQPAGSRRPVGCPGPARSRGPAAASSRFASAGQDRAPGAVRDLESVARSRAAPGQIEGNADLRRGCPAPRGTCPTRFLLHAAIRLCPGGLGCPGGNWDASLRRQAPV